MQNDDDRLSDRLDEITTLLNGIKSDTWWLSLGIKFSVIAFLVLFLGVVVVSATKSAVM